MDVFFSMLCLHEDSKHFYLSVFMKRNVVKYFFQVLHKLKMKLLPSAKMSRIRSALNFSFANSFSIFLKANDENRSCDIVVLSQVLMHLMAEKFLSHPAELIGIPIAICSNL